METFPRAELRIGLNFIKHHYWPKLISELHLLGIGDQLANYVVKHITTNKAPIYLISRANQTVIHRPSIEELPSPPRAGDVLLEVYVTSKVPRELVVKALEVILSS